MKRRIKIDEINAKILKTLLEESRTSFTEIAKTCKISVGAVRMRYKHLWKAGIINGEIMQVNPYSLGYRCVSSIGIVTAKENESEVKEFLKSKHYITKIIEAWGKYNFGIIVALSSIQKLSGIQQELQANPLITHENVMIWSETINMDHPENLRIDALSSENERKTNPSPVTISYEETQIDEKDRQIARMLAQNSRTPFRKIAEQLDISTKNVIQRYTKLRGKLLTFSAITVDLKKLGYNAMAGMFLQIENKSKIPEIHAQLLQTPNLIVAVKYVGLYQRNNTFSICCHRRIYQFYHICGMCR